MATVQEILTIRTTGRGLRDVTDQIARVVEAAAAADGLCHVFSRHTSAGVVITENADPTVPEDHERLVAKLIPDGWHEFRHRTEGDDDMAAHARTLLAGEGVLVPVRNGELALGRWQGIFLWEHRTGGHFREVVVTVLG